MYVSTSAQPRDAINNLGIYVQQQGTTCGFSGSAAWVVLSPIEQSIKRKIESVGKPLRDWDISINYGIKTGYNDAFIITTERRDEILSNCKSEEERQRTEAIIRPILRGRDIKRYSYDWAGLWLIWIPWHFPLHLDPSIQGASAEAEQAFMNQYPSVYQHLLLYKPQLSARNKAETGIRYEWYALQRWGANYSDDFSQPKIVWKRVGSILRFSYDKAGLLSLDSTCFAVGKDIEFICCVLNSPMGHFLLKDAPQTGTGDLLVSVQAVEPLMLPSISDEDNIYFAEKIGSLSQMADNDSEQEVTECIFNLYGLNTEERNYIIANYG